MLIVGLESCPALHLGVDPDAEINDETVQFSSCAMIRNANYITSGIISAHLQRSAVIAARVALRRPAASGSMKRPAGRPAC